MKRLLFLSLLFLLPVQKSRTINERPIDLVFCVDLSGSSNGILDDVRERIWEVINKVHTYRPTPQLRIGVVGYSRPSFGAKSGYVKLIKGLTDDFESINRELYKLKPYIEKGDQLVGMALRTSVKEMKWADHPDAVKVIYLIGNGMVDLGPTNYIDVCEIAQKENIIINTLYCHTRNDAVKELPGWRNIARLTGGTQFDIFIHKRPPVLITSPDPAAMVDLDSKLTSTYIYFGKGGEERFKMLVAGDKNATEANLMTLESRLAYKISEHFQYRQSSWDLVDYLRTYEELPGPVELTLIPDSLKKKSPEYILGLGKRLREARINTINQLRNHIPYDRQDIIDRMLDERGVRISDNFERTVINSMNQLVSSRGFQTSSNGKLEFTR